MRHRAENYIVPNQRAKHQNAKSTIMSMLVINLLGVAAVVAILTKLL